MPQKPHFRTIWISDVHLATPDCKAEALRSFLKSHSCDKLYLVGDIIDGWAVRSNGWFWPGAHNQVVRQILRKSEKENTEIYYVAGNHDEFLRDYLDEHDLTLGNIKVVQEKEHFTADGRRLWVVHGDHYDVVMKHYKAIEFLGDVGYAVIMTANRAYDTIRRKLDLPKVSLASLLKSKIRLVNDFTAKFEMAVSKEAAYQGYNGVVCGHIHRANHIKNVNDVAYWNCGDWVESCTAVVEDQNGKLSVVEWSEDYLENEKTVHKLRVLHEE